jgi:hypothetical protein
MERPPSKSNDQSTNESSTKIDKKNIFDAKVLDLIKNRRATAVFPAGDGDGNHEF